MTHSDFVIGIVVFGVLAIDITFQLLLINFKLERIQDELKKKAKI